jgi:NACalpha-BTF3-like transcription factor
VLNLSIQEIEKALAASKREADDERAGPSSKRADKEPSKEIQQVMSTTNCSQDAAEKALQEAGGNMDSAVLKILTKSFSKK